jgi:hypothetical protein
MTRNNISRPKITGSSYLKMSNIHSLLAEGIPVLLHPAADQGKQTQLNNNRFFSMFLHTLGH